MPIDWLIICFQRGEGDLQGQGLREVDRAERDGGRPEDGDLLEQRDVL